MITKSIFENPVVGDKILCGTFLCEIVLIKEHEPGTHDKSPIKNNLKAIEYVTTGGSRWRGV